MTVIGQELKRERELRGISLKEIADTTKISIKFLKALEEDQLDILPGKFFIKGIIRAYAKYLGLEEDYVLNKYYEDILTQEQVQKDEDIEKEDYSAVPKKTKKFLYLAILFILFLIISGAFYLFFQKKERSAPPEKPQAPRFVQEEKPSSSPLTPPVKESKTEEKEIILELSFSEKTWIQVYADGELKLEGIKLPGEKAKIKALDELLIHLGNAGGLSYTLNNKKGKQFGSSGAVVKNIKITTENLHEFFDEET